MSDNWTGQGYEAEASQGGGVYLRLKQKGQTVRLRLVSEAYRYMDTIEDRENQTSKQIRKVAWIAIAKELVNGQPQKRVVVFQAGPMVYGLIRDLRESPDWGDPRNYDIGITRTEEQGRYYSVTPFPKPIGPITESEQQMVAEANIDLVAACTRGHEPGPANGQTGEDDPFAE